MMMSADVSLNLGIDHQMLQGRPSTQHFTWTILAFADTNNRQMADHKTYVRFYRF